MCFILDVRTQETIQRALPLSQCPVLLVKWPGSALGNALEHNSLGPLLPELVLYRQSFQHLSSAPHACQPYPTCRGRPTTFSQKENTEMIESFPCTLLTLPKVNFYVVFYCKSIC